MRARANPTTNCSLYCLRARRCALRVHCYCCCCSHTHTHTQTHTHTHTPYTAYARRVRCCRRIACCRCIAVCGHMFVDIWQLYADTHTSMHTSIIVHACINKCIVVCIRLCSACRKSASITAMYLCIEHTCMTEGSTRQASSHIACTYMHDAGKYSLSYFQKACMLASPRLKTHQKRTHTNTHTQKTDDTKQPQKQKQLFFLPPFCRGLARRPAV